MGDIMTSTDPALPNNRTSSNIRDIPNLDLLFFNFFRYFYPSFMYNN